MYQLREQREKMTPFCSISAPKLLQKLRTPERSPSPVPSRGRERAGNNRGMMNEQVRIIEVERLV
jgi:hypothetical protein